MKAVRAKSMQQNGRIRDSSRSVCSDEISYEREKKIMKLVTDRQQTRRALNGGTVLNAEHLAINS